MSAFALICSKVCVVFSCFGVALLTTWAVMLINQSVGSFHEVPAHARTKTGVGCLCAASLYALCAIGSLIWHITLSRKQKPVPAPLATFRNHLDHFTPISTYSEVGEAHLTHHGDYGGMTELSEVGESWVRPGDRHMLDREPLLGQRRRVSSGR
eukprot:GHVN01064655.1.p1 GENE.GHVN01064655.1~~GHVN01064655.1.p1  ORF type:complete len:154 (-),score=16.05 GHVN01064655.1:192-653(-)